MRCGVCRYMWGIIEMRGVSVYVGSIEMCRKMRRINEM